MDLYRNTCKNNKNSFSNIVKKYNRIIQSYSSIDDDIMFDNLKKEDF